MSDKTLQPFVDIADKMIAREANLKKAQLAYERMSRLQYNLPEPLRSLDWVRPIITSAPYDALRGAQRALSNLEEGITIHPVTVAKALGGESETREAALLANRWETVLKWCLGKTSRRRKNLVEDVVWSSALYDIVVGKLIHVPTQIKATGMDGPRKAAAARLGDWALRIVDPKTVYAEWSEYMLERVLSVTVRSAQEILDIWGDKAKWLKAEIRKKPKKDQKAALAESYVEYDYVDHEHGRVVWAHKGDTPDIKREGHLLFGPEPWLTIKEHGEDTGRQVPFLPYIVSAGGTLVDTAPEFQLKPILFPVYMTEQWATANIMGTIMMSEAIAAAGSERDVITGPGAEDVEIDYSEPRPRINLTPFQTYQVVKSGGLDTAIREAFDRLESSINRATVADVLVTAQPISGEQAYASYNLQVMQALASLGGVRAVAERFLEQTLETMLLMSHYTGHDIKGYGDGLEEYVIDSEDIDPESIYIEVQLHGDVPADRVQRITAAVQLAQSDLSYSPKRLLEMLGETDPEGALREYKLWQLELADFRGKLKRIEMEASGELEQMAAQMAQGMIAQMQAAPEEMGPFGEMANPPNQFAPPGIEGVEGQMFNPAAGGIPPILASPEGASPAGRRGRPRGVEMPPPGV